MLIVSAAESSLLSFLLVKTLASISLWILCNLTVVAYRQRGVDIQQYLVTWERPILVWSTRREIETVILRQRRLEAARSDFSPLSCARPNISIGLFPSMYSPQYGDVSLCFLEPRLHHASSLARSLESSAEALCRLWKVEHVWLWRELRLPLF
jgi:hypothetical protein